MYPDDHPVLCNKYDMPVQGDKHESLGVGGYVWPHACSCVWPAMSHSSRIRVHTGLYISSCGR